ncbi:MAG TPA: isochorismatase family cysteine hydrolase [Stellaceae bacterium]|nr:isochorismatase family cysteine hydrolase [Stellaceae bacterium]
MKDFGLSRNVPVRLGATALLFVDVQNYSAEGGGEYAHLPREEVERRYGYFFREMRERAVPNMRRLQLDCRKAGIEVMYTVIQSLTKDGREMGLDYKISGLFCPAGSRDGQVIDAIAPVGDEIVIPKTSSSVFISTNIHYLLGNLGVRHLIVCGVLTDQCVDSTVRDACDLGYLVTLVTDACATQSEERHRSSIANNSGYCRQVTTDELVRELAGLSPG